MSKEFGKMIIKARCDITFTGIKLDLAKSALQKYIRRGDEYKVALILTDINMVSMVEDPVVASNYVSYHKSINTQKKDQYKYEVSKVQSHAKSIITNTINRLIVCGSEDIGIANNNCSDNLESLLTDRSLENQIKQAIMLTRSQKVRLISDYKTMYMLPPYYWKNDKQEGLMRKAHSELQLMYPFMTPDLTGIGNWEQALKEKNSEAFFYLLGKDLERHGYVLKTIGTNIVFSNLKKILGSTSLTRIYAKMGHQEKPMYLYHEALKYMGLGQNQDINVSDINPIIYSNHIKSGKKYVIDSFCMDRHTAQGRTCSTLQFAIEGAHVENQASKFYKWNNRLIYIIFKVVVDNLGKINTIDLTKKIDHTILDQILPSSLPVGLKDGSPGKQYDFLVEYYRGKITNKKASGLLNESSPLKRTFKKVVNKKTSPPVSLQKHKVPENVKQCNPKLSKAKDDRYICNPATGQWVKKDGKIGSELIKKYGESFFKSSTKKPSQVKNKPIRDFFKSTKEPSQVKNKPTNRKQTLCSKESVYFEPITRIQIGTGASKTDVYYANLKVDLGALKKGTRVVVKGPYNSDDKGCEYAKAMSTWKKNIGLPYVENIYCLKIVPDLWSSVKGLGIRYKHDFDNTKPYPFMISDDLMHQVQDIPITMKASKKWEKVTVLDFAHHSLKPFQWKVFDNWDSLEDIEKTRLIVYYVIRYIAGIGDLADRNFLNINGTIIAIDEDAPKKGILNKPSMLLPGRSKGKVVVKLNSWLRQTKNIESVLKFLKHVKRSSIPEVIAINDDIFSKLTDKDTILSLFS